MRPEADASRRGQQYTLPKCEWGRFSGAKSESADRMKSVRNFSRRMDEELMLACERSRILCGLDERPYGLLAGEIPRAKSTARILRRTKKATLTDLAESGTCWEYYVRMVPGARIARRVRIALAFLWLL
jgi:hypothetical protein